MTDNMISSLEIVKKRYLYRDLIFGTTTLSNKIFPILIHLLITYRTQYITIQNRHSFDLL